MPVTILRQITLICATLKDIVGKSKNTCFSDISFAVKNVRVHGATKHIVLSKSLN